MTSVIQTALNESLILACASGEVTWAKSLLDSGAEVNYFDKARRTSSMHSPIAEAITLGNEAMLELLVSYGVDTHNYKYHFGAEIYQEPPLLKACLCLLHNTNNTQRINSVKLLVQSGANFNKEVSNGQDNKCVWECIIERTDELYDRGNTKSVIDLMIEQQPDILQCVGKSNSTFVELLLENRFDSAVMLEIVGSNKPLIRKETITKLEEILKLRTEHGYGEGDGFFQLRPLMLSLLRIQNNSQLLQDGLDGIETALELK